MLTLRNKKWLQLKFLLFNVIKRFFSKLWLAKIWEGFSLQDEQNDEKRKVKGLY